MSELSSGMFKILSVFQGSPATSICLWLGPIVRLDRHVQVWNITQQANDSDIYNFSIGGYGYTGVSEDNVIATVSAQQDVKWFVSYSEAQDAYAIEYGEDRSKGWTVSRDSDANPGIEIKPIMALRTYPPMYLASQLFKFVRQPDNE